MQTCSLFHRTVLSYILEMVSFQVCELPWHGQRQERPDVLRPELMAEAAPGRSAPLDPPTHDRIKAGLDVRGPGGGDVDIHP